MSGSSERPGAVFRGLRGALLPLLFVGIGIAAVRGIGIPQNGFVGLVLLVVAAVLTISSLLRAGPRGEE